MSVTEWLKVVQMGAHCITAVAFLAIVIGFVHEWLSADKADDGAVDELISKTREDAISRIEVAKERIEKATEELTPVKKKAPEPKPQFNEVMFAGVMVKVPA